MVAYNESAKVRVAFGGKAVKVHVDKTSQQCIDCHERKSVAVKGIDAWKTSTHADQGIGCIECHEAKEGDFDAFTCPESSMLVARYPTPKDCEECHEQQVTEFAESKHAFQFWLISAADRTVFEPDVATKNGCQECHNLANLWPDGSVGECDVCHPKHNYSKAVARQPETCGECHIGPDHPHIEIYLESKHGNIFKAKGQGKWDLNYKTDEKTPIPIEAPVCTTCHMDGAPGEPMTHNVSARLAWESQSPWSFRTVWFSEKLGSWQDKRQRMVNICSNCHSPDFIEGYLLQSDLAVLQYNELRRQFVKWAKKYTAAGLTPLIKLGDTEYSSVLLNGWDQEAKENWYNSWHHEGRRYRHGALMMGADYTQWHGIWELQTNLIRLIEFGAENGDEEAKAIFESTSPTKFFTYKLYDMPGNIWGVNTDAAELPALYKIIPNYWEKIKANVETAYKAGLLTDDQWEFWMERYNNKDHYLGTKYPEHEILKRDKELNKKDTEAWTKQGPELQLPSPTPFEDVH
ncbi:cytochrome C [Clostridiales bacterium PH28_bin88]|nr:cytochrome C [Clostridiales bacterium PH28_bin88]